MSKVKITADAVLSIIRGIFEDEDVNAVVDTVTAPEEWQGKAVTEVLNTEYYAYKYRPPDTMKRFHELLEAERNANRLGAIDRSFCQLSITETDRLYSKDTDMVALGVSLEYCLQTDKVKLLEYLVETANIKLSGQRITVAFGDEVRKAVVFFGPPITKDIQSASSFGEIAFVDITVVIAFYPNVVSYCDYTVSFKYTVDGEEKKTAVPLTSFVAGNTMTQESTPHMNNPRNTGNINLARMSSFVLTFDGYDNDFINYITDKSFTSSDASADNNELLTLIIERGEHTYEHEVIIKDHQITVNADTGNEAHTLSLVRRGIVDGTT